MKDGPNAVKEGERLHQDGRARYPGSLREAMYTSIIQTAKKLRPELEIALCLEDKALWERCGIESNLGKYNCVW